MSTLALACVCGVVGTLASVFIIRFLIPLVQGMFAKDFSNLESTMLTRQIIQLMPNAFASYEARFSLIVFIVFSFGVIRELGYYVAAVIAKRQSTNVMRNLRLAAFSRLINHNQYFHDQVGLAKMVGKVLNRSRFITRQISHLHEFIQKILALAAYFAVLYWLSAQLLLISMIVFPLGGFIYGRLAKRIKAVTEQQNDAAEELDESTMGLLHCRGLILAQGAQKDAEQRFEAVVDEEYSVERKSLFFTESVRPIKEIISLLALLTVAIFLGTISGAEVIDTSKMLVFLLVLNLSAPTYQTIAHLRMQIGAARPALERFKRDLENTKYDLISGEQAIKNLHQQISARSLNFRYQASEEHTKVFDNFSCDIPAFKSTAIVGPSGSGKSTLIKLLLRLYPIPYGQLFADGIDFNDISLHDYRKLISVVTQDAYFFNGTLRENLVFGLEREVTDPEILDVMQILNLQALIERLEHGIDSEVGDRGSVLSGGERQRLSLARAILRDTPVVILDEPTSSLDRENELRVRQFIKNYAGEKTIIVVTHSQDLAAACDHHIDLSTNITSRNSDTNSEDVLLAETKGQASEQLPR